MTDLIERLRGGIIEHPRRWSGDTHDDLGGSADYDATELLMFEAAAALEAKDAEIARLREALERIEVIGLCDAPRSHDAIRASTIARAALGD
jgi:hypothetical protein